MHTTVGRRGVFLAAAAAAFLGGCAAEPSTEPASQTAAVPSVSDPAMVDLQLNHLLPSADQVLTIEARQLAIEDACFREAGISAGVTISDPPAVPRYVDYVIRTRVTFSPIWGFFDPNTVASRGYQPADQVAPFTEEPPAGASPELVKTCDEQGRELVGGRHWAELLFPQSLPDGGPPTVETNDAIAAVNTAWSACMKEHGQAYSTPLMALTRWATESSASTGQIATATADVACKVSTNLVGVVASVQNQAAETYMADHADALRSYRQAVERASN